MRQITPPMEFDFAFDVLLYQQGVSIRSFGHNDNDPYERGESLRDAIAYAQPGDFLQLGHGKFSLDHKDGNLVCPDVTIKGMGKYDTLLWGDVWSDAQGTQVALHNTRLYDLGIQNKTYQPTEDGRCIGFDGSNFTAYVKNCAFFAGAWCFYDWSPGNKIVLEDCDFFYGRHGISNENSGSGSSVIARRCQFNGDALLSFDIGATSSPIIGGVYGLVARGGYNELTDCEMNLVGHTPQVLAQFGVSYTPHVVGVTDFFGDVPSSNTQIVIRRLVTKINPNGCDPKLCGDMRVTDKTVAGNMIIDGWYGSGSKGALTSTNDHTVVPG